MRGESRAGARSRFSGTFAALRRNHEPGLVVYLCAGDPDLDASHRLLLAAVRGGADILEVGVPFSDPTADGPVIQAASERALAAGTTCEDVLDLVYGLRVETDVPIVLFGYYNPLLQYGISRLCTDAAHAGVDGLLVVDLPPEESGELDAAAHGAGLDVIRLVAPTSDDRRVKRIVGDASGFLYLVSRTGVTGAGAPEAGAVRRQVQRVRAHSPLPVLAGFGVSTPADAAALRGAADGIVVGSAAVQLAHDLAGRDDQAAELQAFIASLKTALVSGRAVG